MSSTKIFLKITVLFAMILTLAYIFRIEEHLPVMVRSAYQSLLYFMMIGLILGISVTVFFTVIDMADLDNRFGPKKI